MGGRRKNNFFTNIERTQCEISKEYGKGGKVNKQSWILCFWKLSYFTELDEVFLITSAVELTLEWRLLFNFLASYGIFAQGISKCLCQRHRNQQRGKKFAYSSFISLPMQILSPWYSFLCLHPAVLDSVLGFTCHLLLRLENYAR